jgi:uncharacterized damage-inducible protein DinB
MAACTVREMQNKNREVRGDRRSIVSGPAMKRMIAWCIQESTTRVKPDNGREEQKMKEMTADNAMFLLQGVYLPTLKNESQLTKKVIEAVPAEKAEYRPDPVSKTAMELVRHIAAADVRFADTVINGKFETGAVLPADLKTPVEIAAWYEKSYAERLEALSKLTSEQLMKIVDFRGMFQRPAVMFLMIGAHHTIHHRGQLSSYLRCMGAKVPSIYGESYDAEQARKAAQA